MSEWMSEWISEWEVILEWQTIWRKWIQNDVKENYMDINIIQAHEPSLGDFLKSILRNLYKKYD